VEQVRQVDVHVLVVAILVRDQPRLHPAVEETVDHEKIRRLEVSAAVFEIDVVTWVHVGLC
jgi:hypothetical protein